MTSDNLPCPGTLLESHWPFLAFNGIQIVVLRAYFDETHSQRPKGIGLTAVAGFLFEPKRLADLHAEWRADPLIARMPFPHASHCSGRRGQFVGFEKPDRIALMLRVNQLAAKHRGPGFVCDLNDEEFNSWANRGRRSSRLFPNPYTMCVFGALSVVRQQLHLAEGVKQPIVYCFERGAAGQQQCDALLRQISQDDILRDRYGMIAYAFGCKKSDPAFACADALAWEWQRNKREATQNDAAGIEDPGWRDTFKAFFIDESSPPIRHMTLGPRDFDAAYLEARFHGLRGG